MERIIIIESILRQERQLMSQSEIVELETELQQLKRKEVTSKILNKVKKWLEDEVKANEKYKDDYTDTAECLLTMINIWENEEQSQ